MIEDTLQLFILTGVNLTLEIGPGIEDALSFTVKGPAEAIRTLSRTAIQQSNGGVKGMLSPRCLITLSQEARTAAGVPPGATHFAFAYPFFDAQRVFSQLIGLAAHAPWLFFLLLGGFCYFDEAGTLLQLNALALSESEQSLHLVGPHTASDAACEWLRAHGRLHPITLPALQASGFKGFGWVHPQESPGGFPFCPEEVLFPDGAFVYEISEAGFLFYKLAMDTAPKTSGDTRLEKGIVQAKKHRVTDQALQAWASSVGSEETRSHVRQKSEAGAKADRGLRGFIGGMYEDWIVNLEEAERLTLQQRKDRDPRVQAIP